MVRIPWNSVYSNSFPFKNGVKQGAIISQVLFCCYIDKLLFNLAPTSRAMRCVLFTCESFADNFSIVFTAKKSKCLIFEPTRKASSFINQACFYI